MMSKGGRYKIKSKADIPKRPLRRVTSYPKTRSKAGCFTCRKRKKKCDECYPICSGCARNFLCCVWPDKEHHALPKDFEIKSSTGSNIRAESTDTLSSAGDEAIESSFHVKIPLKSDLFNSSETDMVPRDMCSVIPLNGYELNRNSPKKSSSIIMFRVHPTATSSCESKQADATEFLHELQTDSAISEQTVNQMFNSLQKTLKSGKLSWHPTDNESDAYNRVYSHLMENFLPENLQESNTNTLTSFKRISALREIFLAYGSCSLEKTLGKEYLLGTSITDKHYERAKNLIRQEMMDRSLTEVKINGKQSTEDKAENDWLLPCINIIQSVNKSIDLISKKCLDNIGASLNKYNSLSHTVEGAQRTIILNFIFNYSIGLYFLPKAKLELLPSPFEVFGKFRSQFSTVLFADKERGQNWLSNVVIGSVFNCFENLCKLLWTLRMASLLSVHKRTSYLGQIKRDMTLIWTTLQTSEIQLDSKKGDEKIRPILKYAKYFHQSLEILHIKLSDPSVQSTNPVISFYLSQFMRIYKSADVSSFLNFAPLFICGCSSRTLEDRAFLSKELYFTAQKLDLPFIEDVTKTLEDRWCIEESGGNSTFNSLTSRAGFEALCE